MSDEEVINRCVICGVDMGSCNPRQYCMKYYCPQQLEADDTYPQVEADDTYPQVVIDMTKDESPKCIDMTQTEAYPQIFIDLTDDETPECIDLTGDDTP